jgi:hypothetical protein
MVLYVGCGPGQLRVSCQLQGIMNLRNLPFCILKVTTGSSELAESVGCSGYHWLPTLHPKLDMLLSMSECGKQMLFVL